MPTLLLHLLRHRCRLEEEKRERREREKRKCGKERIHVGDRDYYIGPLDTHPEQ